MTIINSIDVEKKFEFEVSCTFRCWGDRLEIDRLKYDLGLNKVYCKTKSKGQFIGQYDKSFKGKSKTGSLSYSCLQEFPGWESYPYKQLDQIIKAILSLGDVTLSSYLVETSELQISCYYGNKLEGENCELFFDNKFIQLLNKQSINLKYIMLP